MQLGGPSPGSRRTANDVSGRNSARLLRSAGFQPAVSPTSSSASPRVDPQRLRIRKSATQQTWKSALRRAATNYVALLVIPAPKTTPWRDQTPRDDTRFFGFPAFKVADAKHLGAKHPGFRDARGSALAAASATTLFVAAHGGNPLKSRDFGSCVCSGS